MKNKKLFNRKEERFFSLANGDNGLADHDLDAKHCKICGSKVPRKKKGLEVWMSFGEAGN